MTTYQKDDLIEVISGTHAGKTGKFRKYGSNVFPDHCRVDLDHPKGRKSKFIENVFIELKNIQPMATTKKQTATAAPDADKYFITGGILNIDLKEIAPDPNQPRKFFNEQELKDLAASIMEVGVIEPILVRPVDGKAKGVPKVKYMVVFGERRLRASLIAAKETSFIMTIPSMIKELTDDEALELQITENLQRHDPHPMEEAVAFAQMQKQYDVKEIATRAGKSVKFVAGRLLLNDLVPQLQEMFFAGCMDMQDAHLLARQTIETQTSFLKEEVPENWKEREGYEVGNISWYFKNANKELDEAPFDITDKLLYKEKGACTECPFNSANTLLLHLDEVGPVCTNGLCYTLKCEKAYTIKLNDVLINPEILLINTTRSWNATPKDIKRIAAAEALGGVVIKDDMFEIIEDLEVPNWDAFLEEQKHWSDDDDKEDIDNWLQDVKDEFAQEQKEYDEQLANIAKAKAENLIKKAFVVAGDKAGTIVEIIPNEQALEKTGQASTGGAAMEPSVKEQIKAIEKREERAKELDGEKIWQGIHALMTADKCKILHTTDPIVGNERPALAMAMYNSLDYHGRDNFNAIVKFKGNRGDHLSDAKFMETISDAHFNLLCRLLIASKLFNSSLSSHERSSDCYWGKKVAVQHAEVRVREIVEAQSEKADKRIKRVNERIEALKPASKSKKK